jgi:D-sedoheptulose 7-phosphate isomerase
MIEKIKANFIEAQKVLDDFIKDDQTWLKMEASGKIMIEAIKNGGKIFSCGNGGSLCDAMHFAEELTGKFQKMRKAMPAIAIADPTHMTCVGNDFGYEYIFSRYIEGLGKPGDVLLAISCSGSSPNILNAVKSARSLGMKVVALTGKTGGELGQFADVEIRAPKSEYADRAQEIHIKVIHSLINYIELNVD